MRQQKIIHQLKKLFITLAIIANINVTLATTVNVSSIDAMQAAINVAAAGDTIILANGTYLTNTFNISTNNITVKSATPGGVYLNGSNAITISGDHITFSGFQFTAGTITTKMIAVRGNYNTLTQLNFNGYTATHMINIYGQYNVISYCNFQNKPALDLTTHGGTGDMVQIIPDPTIIGYNTIRYCSFQHMPGMGGDYGNECIRIGDSQYATYISRTVVEYCYFEDTGDGDSEAISVKSRENCLRFNTMVNNPDAMFAFRNGDNNIAYSNFFINSGGIRCKQANNIYCYNNYFQRSGNAANSFPPVSLEYFGAGYGNNFNFIHNTFYKCTASLIDTGLTNCTWANNIFDSDSSTIFSGTTSGQIFAGNMYQGIPGLPISSGIIEAEPLLMLNAKGYVGLSATSPAIGAADINYPAILNITALNNDPTILLDIEGQPRPAALSLKDIGCDQYSAAPVVHHPLSIEDAGPCYLSGYSWSGAVSTVWEDPLNWIPGVLPDSTSKVIIPSGLSLYPEIHTAPIIHSIHIKPGAAVTITPGHHLTILQ